MLEANAKGFEDKKGTWKYLTQSVINASFK